LTVERANGPLAVLSPRTAVHGRQSFGRLALWRYSDDPQVLRGADQRRYSPPRGGRQGPAASRKPGDRTFCTGRHRGN
jgi:hypothetical protein